MVVEYLRHLDFPNFILLLLLLIVIFNRSLPEQGPLIIVNLPLLQVCLIVVQLLQFAFTHETDDSLDLSEVDADLDQKEIVEPAAQKPQVVEEDNCEDKGFEGIVIIHSIRTIVHEC